MAKQEFLDNFRVARNFFVHDEEGAATAGRAALWLTPKSIKGFDAADFAELGLARQSELQTAAHAFADIADHVPPAEAATEEQLKLAKASFARMLSILDRYVPAPPEGKKIEEALKTIAFPSWVVDWSYELDNDWVDEPGVWVTLFIDQRKAPRAELGQLVGKFTGPIRHALLKLGVQRWPYIRVRLPIEHKSA